MSSFDWMQKAKSSVNRKADFRELGTANIDVVFSMGEEHQIVTFDAFAVGTVRKIEDELDLLDVGVRIRMTPRQWAFYMRRRHAGKAPSLVAFNLGRDVIKFTSAVDRLKFMRVHKTIQAFVDAGARYAQ